MMMQRSALNQQLLRPSILSSLPPPCPFHLPCSACSLAAAVLLLDCVRNTRSNSAGAAALTWNTARLGWGWLMLGRRSLTPFWKLLGVLLEWSSRSGGGLAGKSRAPQRKVR